MIASPWRSRRWLIPRWRSLSVTMAAHELAVPYPKEAAAAAEPMSSSLQERIINWKERPSVMSAGELVGAALVEGREQQAVEAASVLLSPRSSATSGLRKLAELTRKRAVLDTASVDLSTPDYRRLKRQWRLRTRLHPASALAWVELSLLDVISDRERAAKRSMSVALQLAPNNRHVLRSACRLYLHFGDPGRAYETITKCDAIRTDPWLMAAELAIAELAECQPRFFNRGRVLVMEGTIVPRQFTELAGAVGTLELIAGRRKRARDYFRKSVIAPTGNALAQAEWASPSFGSELVDQAYVDTATEIEEAIALQYLNNEEYRKVPGACEVWAHTEPYAIRPYEIGSSVSALLEDYGGTLSTAQRGLKIHPKSGLLLNNYAFALANLGELGAAQKILARIVSRDGPEWPVSEANRGLVAMRRGAHDLGVSLYRNAIGDFRRRGSGRGADIASIYLAREAAIAGICDADRLIKGAREAMKRPGTKGYEGVMEQAEKALSVARRRATQRGESKGC